LGLQDYNLMIEEQQVEWDEIYGFEEFFEADPYDYINEFEEEEDNGEDLEYDYSEPDDYNYFGMDDSSSFNVYPEDLDTFMDRFDDFLKS